MTPHTDADLIAMREDAERLGLAANSERIDNDPGYDDPEGHAAMLEAHAERPERCIAWAALGCGLWIAGWALLAVLS